MLKTIMRSDFVGHVWFLSYQLLKCYVKHIAHHTVVIITASAVQCVVFATTKKKKITKSSPDNSNRGLG